MLKRLKQTLCSQQPDAGQTARAQCLRIVDDTIAECAEIECWNYTAKRIRDKIAALDLIGNSNDLAN
jgi:hypothetical protein